MEKRYDLWSSYLKDANVFYKKELSMFEYVFKEIANMEREDLFDGIRIKNVYTMFVDRLYEGGRNLPLYMQSISMIENLKNLTKGDSNINRYFVEELKIYINLYKGIFDVREEALKQQNGRARQMVNDDDLPF